MNTKFKKNKILNNNEIIAQELKNVRQKNKLTKQTVADKININIKYIEAMENGHFDKLPEGVYGKNFIREYMRFLGINTEMINDMENTETKKKLLKKQKRLFSIKAPGIRYFIALPKIIKNIIITVLILICVSYLVYYINNIVSPPKILIIYPQKDQIIKKNNITIIGKTEPEINITINNKKILLSDKGNFSENINLNTGINVITIVGQKKYSKQQIIVRNIIVEK